jgi:hypothetical protein
MSLLSVARMGQLIRQHIICFSFLLFETINFYRRATMSLLSVARMGQLIKQRVACPAMSSAASSLKQCLLNVPPTEV